MTGEQACRLWHLLPMTVQALLDVGPDLIGLFVDGAPLAWTGPAPRLGQHTREVLQEIGYSGERIEAALTSGAAQASTD